MRPDPLPIVVPTGRNRVAEYAARAPLALALERSLECDVYSGRELGRPVLDLGCGDGTFIEVLLGRSDQVDYGLDSDSRELGRARRRGVYLEVLHASAEDIPLPSGSIATVICNSTLEHIRDLDPVLVEINRVLRPGGKLLATVPTDRFDRYAALYRFLAWLRWGAGAERFRRLYDAFWKHFHYHSPAGWRTRLEAAGLEVEELREYCPPSRCTSHDLLVPLALVPFIMKNVVGRYFLFPPLRRALVRLIRPALPGSATHPVPAGTGGLVLLVARRPETGKVS